MAELTRQEKRLLTFVSSQIKKQIQED